MSGARDLGRICVIGGGIAGSLLAWRLARTGRCVVDLVIGFAATTPAADATGVSGGVVRAFETDPRLAAAALDSLVELRSSETLRRWARYDEVGSLYVLRRTAGLAEAVAEVGEALPGSARLLSGRELAAAGWAGLPADAVAVAERFAGSISPDGLRRGVLDDLGRRPGVRVLAAPVAAIEPTAEGVRLAGVSPAGGSASGAAGPVTGGRYDLVVVAAGRWTGPLLERSALPAAGLRTKSVQYTIHPVAGPRPPAFVDETTGLFGRPVGRDRMLLGVPVDLWGVDPDVPADVPAARADALRHAARRLPGMHVLDGPVARAVSADSYAYPPMLALRPVQGSGDRVLTFAGGSGGSAKTALAASRRAAALLTLGRLVAA